MLTTIEQDDSSRAVENEARTVHLERSGHPTGVRVLELCPNCGYDRAHGPRLTCCAWCGVRGKTRDEKRRAKW